MSTTAALLAGCLAALLPTRAPVPQLLATAPSTMSTKWSDLVDEAQRLTDAQAARTVAAVCSDGVLVTRVSAPGAEGAALSSYAAFVVDEQAADGLTCFEI